MKIEKYNAPVVKNIKAIIDKKGLKQKTVARDAGFNEKEFSAMLTNRKIIKVDEIMPIANALGVTPNAFVRYRKKRRRRNRRSSVKG